MRFESLRTRLIKVNPADTAAITMVTLIEELFAIDARAREQKLDQAARHQLRQEYAPALLAQLPHYFGRDTVFSIT